MRLSAARGGGKALDVELLLLRARAGPVTSSDKLRHPLRGPHLPSGSLMLKSEFRRTAQTPVYKKSRYGSGTKKDTHLGWDALVAIIYSHMMKQRKEEI